MKYFYNRKHFCIEGGDISERKTCQTRAKRDPDNGDDLRNFKTRLPLCSRFSLISAKHSDNATGGE